MSGQDKLTEKIIGCAIAVHREIGPGLLESIHESALAVEMDSAGIAFERQVAVPILYKGNVIGEHRLDLIVEKSVILELKSVEKLNPVFEAQILSYLRMTKMKVGLLINFNSHLLHEGIKRFIV